MRNSKKGFTLIELLIVVVIVGILALAAIPLITSNTRDARRAEGEQLLGAARNFTRVEYSKYGSWTTGAAPSAQAAWNQEAGTNDAFTGQYFEVSAEPTFTGSAPNQTGTLVTEGTSDGTGTMTFEVSSGSSSIAWN
jgi:prepilin-type N-terminal cleavage/methylation domain-containing protein